MKPQRKMWISYRTLIALGSALLLNTLALFLAKNIILFYIGIIIALLAVGYVIWSLLFFRKQQNQHMDAVLSLLSFDNKQVSASFPKPFLVLDESNEVIWYNDLFANDVVENENLMGKEFSWIFPEVSLVDICMKKGVSITYKDSVYEIFGERVDRDGKITYVLFFFDITKNIEIESKYTLSRPVVFHLVIDNYEEIFQDSKESDKARISGEIEAILEQFTAENKGLLKRLNRDRYIIILEEGQFKKIIEGKFQILDQVHAISPSDRYTVTLSIGVGFNGENLADNDYRAKQAVEMALGRGGDQAAVKTENGYDFYGGLSQGVEKRTKVKTRVIASAMLDMIRQADRCLVMGHRLADLDCFGSAVGLATAIQKLGKETYVVIDKKKNLVQPLLKKMEQNGYRDLFLDPLEVLPAVDSKTLLFITDTHVIPMLESQEIFEKCQGRVIVIDHHRRMVGYIKDAIVFYHEPFASSASEMVTELIQYFGNNAAPKELEAEALLAGITLDTKNFVLKTGVRTFEAAAYLRKQGANTVAVKSLFSSTMDSYREKAKIVSNAEIYGSCAIATTADDSPEIRIVASQAADELLTISGVKASFSLYPGSGKIQVSARSMGLVNVQLVMEALGGGGHLTMAGSAIEGCTLEEAVELLKQAIDEIILMEQEKIS